MKIENIRENMLGFDYNDIQVEVKPEVKEDPKGMFKNKNSLIYILLGFILLFFLIVIAGLVSPIPH